MKIVTLIARYLLGLLFLVFGLNGFLHFLPLPPPNGLAGQFLGALFTSHYLLAVCFFEVAGAVLLLANRFVPLGLVFLGPIIVNILAFHATMAPEGLGLAAVTTLLWLVVFYSVRGAFAGIFAARA